MKIYKVVPCAESIVIKKKEAAQNAIVRFFDIVKQECVDGWEFHSTAPIVVTRKLGKFKKREEQYNAFVFVKEVEQK
ncbi:MAG: hypothetical protein IKT32_04620 [Clostridia bacterium]|nr:hypothetical protein [Clostridia bacterium]